MSLQNSFLHLCQSLLKAHFIQKLHIQMQEIQKEREFPSGDGLNLLQKKIEDGEKTRPRSTGSPLCVFSLVQILEQLLNKGQLSFHFPLNNAVTLGLYHTFLELFWFLLEHCRFRIPTPISQSQLRNLTKNHGAARLGRSSRLLVGVMALFRISQLMHWLTQLTSSAVDP